MQLHGEVYRELEGRRTQRVTLNEKNYFLKQHFGVGWKEIFKNLLQLRLPIVSAKNEWLAIQKLQKLNIAVPDLVGYGCRGHNPATLQSFLMTRELPPTISLEDYCKNWQTQPPTFQRKFALINEVAKIARTLHQNGMNRAQMRKRTPARWIIKDLSGLYFSSKDVGLTQRDLYRFMKAYRSLPLRVLLNQEKTFWQKVKNRGDKLYQKHERATYAKCTS